MRNLLITGGYGFIGSEVVNQTFKEIPDVGQVVVLDRMDYCARADNVLPEIHSDSRFKFIHGDICDLDLISLILEEYSIDTIIHMAAQSHVDFSFDNSLQYTHDNILGTHTLLEAARKYGKLNRFVHMSTDEVYGEASHDATDPFHEASLLKPTNPYAATKAAAEHLVHSYGCSYKLPWVIIRGNNVYGHGQYPVKLIPKFILLLHFGKKLTIHGKGTSQRTFVHVSDMARGILTVAEKGELHEIYNIGSHNEFTVMEIAEKLCELLEKDMDNSINYVQDRKFNDKRYFIDHSKVLTLGWTEQVEFEQGLKETVDWYLQRAEEYKEKI